MQNIIYLAKGKDSQMDIAAFTYLNRVRRKAK